MSRKYNKMNTNDGDVKGDCGGMQRLMIEIMPKPPRVAAMISALLLVSHPYSFRR
jgi:hypothetical protein